ncbi:hypothetical protein AYL99_04169 [Fonsecaea erecta]|uniref:Heterokaryon incompatibility domain-containing protein n=1 Tax=Fonsecaea erecta TaxID=1367422 RepID=A0A178ZRG8_9EURO|nr:hypothetical protein AYL99_04169 [Fonsecaea erecta]OAP61966.1 hypothetical protein AYL99_04169 [Fonsecaea erecta]
MAVVVVNEQGFREIAQGDPFQYGHLDLENEELRFLVLQPRPDGAGLDGLVSCTMETQPLGSADPFIAVRNARGYRLLQELILVDGKCLMVSVALERFLRHFSPPGDKAVRLWIRYICVDQENPNEMDRYWTRQFQDKMYEMAESVVDMQRFLRDLMDRQVFERVIDSRYSKWTKNWHEMPEKWPLPQVFPIRLGTKPSAEQPTQTYQYVPLDTVADETRIIVIAPNEDKQAPLSLYLAHCPLASDVRYHALSYAWGDSEDNVEVTVMGQLMHIRKNLDRALRSLLGSSSVGCAVWADAICINQSDTSEKNHQIPRIADVYDSAACVVCDVGEADQYSDLAQNFVEHLQDPVIRMDDDYEFIVGKPDRIDPGEIPRLCAALYLFLTRPYFRRVWILQEVALASFPVILCGVRSTTAFEALDTAAGNLCDMLARDPDLAEKMKESTPDLRSVDPTQLLFIRKLLYFRHLHMGGIRPDFIRSDVRDTAPGYLEAAILARDFEASIPHDKLFALWNVARDKVGLDFTADYSRPYEETYMDFTKAWCARSGTLDMIAASEFAQPVDGQGVFYSKASSWCPDWSTPSLSSSLVRRERFRSQRMSMQDDINGRVYCADGGVLQQPDENKYFEFEGNTLHCMGVILDKVDGIVASRSAHLPLEAVVPGLMGFCKDFFAQHNLTTYDDVAQAMVAMVHGDCIGSWPKEEDGSSKISHDEDIWTAPYACIPFLPRRARDQNPHRSRHVPWYGGGYSSLEAWDAVRTIMRGRQLFVSDQGYLGLIPDYVGALGEDRNSFGQGGPLHLAILATCSVPVLLVDHPEIEGAYRFLGTCFVQGWMEGEVLKGRNGCKEPAEFWDAMVGSEKLRIV